MHATERVVEGAASHGGAGPAAAANDLDIVLKPLSRPDLGDIKVDGVLAVGRAEQPFAGYDDAIVVMLSRRHARIFCEAGVVYVADLESRNGTTVNRAGVGQTPCPLRDGDEICFGGVLSYRVEIASRTVRTRPDHALTLTLAPACDASGLQTLVITRFPFLVSKTDAVFSRERGEHAAQLSFLSRRHAHIFVKGGGAWIEDLGSTNGTFVDGLRLQESAVPLQDGALLAFGGDHFTYRVGIARHGEAVAELPAPREPARLAAPAPATAPVAPAAAAGGPVMSPGGKTTFVAAPTSFLEIFCIEHAPEESAEGQRATLPAPLSDAAVPAARRGKRSRAVALWTELASVFQGEDKDDLRRGSRRAGALVAVLVVVAAALVWWGMADRKLKDLVERGEYAQAALLADRALEGDPEDAGLRALATEAALKAHVPTWLAKVAARDFDGAAGVVAGMAKLGERNADLKPLVAELEWLGQLQRLVAGRGGPDKPIRIYADEDQIGALIDRWNADTREHQRALARIASYVPQFAGPHAEALTHLRRLQSEATVHLAAIERLKAAIAVELKRDRPEALAPVLKEAAEKYPGLGGLDVLRQDLARYVEIRDEARARKPGRVFALVHKARFATPPFQESFRALAASGQLPPAELVRQYAVATTAWQAGDAERSHAGLQQMAAGAWAEAVRREQERRQGVVAQFAALQPARTSAGYADQLLAFRTSLDAEEDVHFARATQADMDRQKDTVLVRAQEAMNRARVQWQEYRNGGAIEASQRSETAVSNEFRARARLLAEAQRSARLGLQLAAQLGAAPPEPSVALHEEIRTEWLLQRNAVLELRNVLEPELLKTKLTLLGEPSDEARQTP